MGVCMGVCMKACMGCRIHLVHLLACVHRLNLDIETVFACLVCASCIARILYADPVPSVFLAAGFLSN